MDVFGLRRRRIATLLGALAALSSAASADTIFADGFESGGSCEWGFGTATCPGFEIQTPAVEIPPGEEHTYCYFFQTPNTAAQAIRRWSARLDAGVHHAILYATFDSSWDPLDVQPPGTLTEAPCGYSIVGGYAAWLYAAHAPTAELVLPGDDGSGLPLAAEIAAGQPAYLRIRFVNPGSEPISPTVFLGAEALPAATSYTSTATYVTYNGSISIPPLALGDVETQTCAVPAGVEFWRLSTYTHRQAIEAELRDGASPLVVSTDWEHPTDLTFSTSPFYEFSASGLTYECTFNNTGAGTITAGDDEAVDEVCMGIGYFFPAPRAMFCFNSIGPF